MRDKARLIIPAWGDAYASRLASTMLPALLAPGNLPALSESFAVELVLVTEARLFDLIRSSPSFQAAARICNVRLVQIDDLLTGVPGDYGAVLTHSLFRGFADLGPHMTEIYLIFLNVDFIVSDGSLRHLAKLMREGKRVIHAPSFRAVAEDVWPRLRASVDEPTCTLRLTSREMVKLAFANKHPTVKARTVNQRLSHQTWMDQYYWYVDEDTLIGYQWPVALVAIKPERVVTEPTLVWDYGFVPEAAPTAERHFIGDSDDFFMIEPQSRVSGREMLRLGWISFDDIAKNLSTWTTKEQRECGKQLLKIHAADLPANVDEVIAEARAYMAEIYGRLAPPVSHRGHPLLGRWFDEVKARRGRSSEIAALARARARKPASVTMQWMRLIYCKTFGSPPHVAKFHPLWLDMSSAAWKVAASYTKSEQNILWVGSTHSLLCRGAENVIDPTAILNSTRPSFEKTPYDVCICALMQRELSSIDQLYAAIRPLMKNGAQVVFNVFRTSGLFEGIGYAVENLDFPDIDISEIHFYGTWATAPLRALYLRAAHSLLDRPMARALLLAGVLIVLAPLVRLANWLAARRDSSIFSPLWTSLSIEFTVKRAAPTHSQRRQIHQPTGGTTVL